MAPAQGHGYLAAMCLGDKFIVSEVSSFFPFASFVLVCYLSFDDQTTITARCLLASPCPGLAEIGGE